MNFDPNIHAELIYDGGETLHIPERLGTPSPGQLQGTVLERLAELAGRVCYDSLGAAKSRDSAAYHAHIREVDHLSVYEHCPVTLEFEDSTFEDEAGFQEKLIGWCVNRPGAQLDRLSHGYALTVNLRTILDREKFDGDGVLTRDDAREVGDIIETRATALAPRVLTPSPKVEVGYGTHAATVAADPLSSSTWRHDFARVARPSSWAHSWVTLLIGCSRGCSHELVRHGDFTAISQRSTRYVDEAESPWVEHPLRTLARHHLLERGAVDLLNEMRMIAGTDAERALCAAHGPALQQIICAQDTYRVEADALNAFLIERGADKFTARKQARGAARGFLGNALYTELIFSASVRQWHHMLRARCSDAADAEIRVLFGKVLGQLMRSRHRAAFLHLNLVPAKDGIGEVLA